MFKVYLNNRYLWVLGILAILLYMMPYFILGENAYITIHDFLDSNVAHLALIASSNLVGNPEGNLPVLDGVPSINYVSLIPLDVKTILFIILPTYLAIVINTFFVKIVAFLGMYKLCSAYICKSKESCSVIVSVIFSLVPFYVDYGLSSAGLPLLLYAIINLEERRKILQSYFIILFFGLNSSLALVGVFIIFLWGTWTLYVWYRTRTHQTPTLHIYGIMLLIVIYLFSSLSIIYNFFFPSDTISHRVEFLHSNNVSNDLVEVLCFIFFSQYHAGSFLVVVLMAIIVPLFYKYRKKDYSLKCYAYSYLFITLGIFIGEFLRYIPLQIFTSFQFDRFYFLYPSLCFIIFAKAISLINSNYKYYRITIISLCLLSLSSVLLCDIEFRNNTKRLLGISVSNKPSFSQFYDKELFDNIKKDLSINNSNQCKVVCLGFFPSVAEYNKFYTLDSYVFSYSLDYKHKFRKVIEKELDKNETLKTYFDNWGSRCYVFSSELDKLGNRYLCSKKDNIFVEHLDINTNILRELGCDYILSAVTIQNYKELNLQYLNSYTTDNSYWEIRVYKFSAL